MLKKKWVIMPDNYSGTEVKRFWTKYKAERRALMINSWAANMRLAIRVKVVKI